MKKATQKDFAEWYEAQQQLSKWKARELELRLLCAGTYFPQPKEGTNNLPLADGSILKLKHNINRKLDEGMYESLRKSEFKAAKIPLDIVVQEPKFVLSVYRKLSSEQLAVFDQCLIITPGTPSLEIVPPKGEK